MRLGKVADVEKACEDLLSDDEPHVIADAVPAAAKALVEPLKLGENVHRILASPSGAVSRVPLALLAPGIDIAMVPSPSVYASLVASPWILVPLAWCQCPWKLSFTCRPRMASNTGVCLQPVQREMEDA